MIRITITAALKSLRLVLISAILLSMNLGLLSVHFLGLGWDIFRGFQLAFPIIMVLTPQVTKTMQEFFSSG